MIVVFDLETTGLDVDNDRIVQFAAVKLDDSGNIARSLELLINPGIPIPSEATAVHGITDEDVKDARLFRWVVDDILGFIGPKSDLCGHNMIAYDLPLLLAELKRCGRSLSLQDRRLFDTQEIFRHDVPHTLAGALKYYCGHGIGDDAHDALVDAQACADVFRFQVGKAAGWSEPHRRDELAAISLGDRVTLDGKIVRDADGDSCLAFGKHKGCKLRDVPKGFLRWMLSKDFTEETKAVVRRYV
jgi:DNA polymerase-3 subunit epsilon